MNANYTTLRNIKLSAPKPSDPRVGLLALAASTKSLRTANDRLELRVTKLARRFEQGGASDATS